MTLNSHTLLVLLVTSCHPIPTLGPFPEMGGHSGGPLAHSSVKEKPTESQTKPPELQRPLEVEKDPQEEAGQ